MRPTAAATIGAGGFEATTEAGDHACTPCPDDRCEEKPTEAADVRSASRARACRYAIARCALVGNVLL